MTVDPPDDFLSKLSHRSRLGSFYQTTPTTTAVLTARSGGRLRGNISPYFNRLLEYRFVMCSREGKVEPLYLVKINNK